MPKPDDAARIDLSRSVHVTHYPLSRRPHHLTHSPTIRDVAASLREARFSVLKEVPQDRVFRRSLKRPNATCITCYSPIIE